MKYFDTSQINIDITLWNIILPIATKLGMYKLRYCRLLETEQCSPSRGGNLQHVLLHSMLFVNLRLFLPPQKQRPYLDTPANTGN